MNVAEVYYLMIINQPKNCESIGGGGALGASRAGWRGVNCLRCATLRLLLLRWSAERMIALPVWQAGGEALLFSSK